MKPVTRSRRLWLALRGATNWSDPPSSGGTARDRLKVALVVIVVSGVIAVGREIAASNFPSDLDQLLHAANALREGQNPYEVVGPGRAFEWAWPVFYPLPAILIVL